MLPYFRACIISVLMRYGVSTSDAMPDAVHEMAAFKHGEGEHKGGYNSEDE
jgi:hypothetical protein